MAINKTQIGLLRLDRIGLLIRSNSGSDRIGLAIPLKFKVTLKVIACWSLYDSERLS